MAISLIDSLPAFISVADHHALQTSTPASFADIPSVLRLQKDGVDVLFDPPMEGGDAKQGSLYITESALFYFSQTTSKGFRIEYPSITLHAISRAASGPSIYCQLDESVPGAAPQPEDEDAPMREMNLTPTDTSNLDIIFETLSFCASLHPDPIDDEDEGDDDAFLDPDSTTFETFNGTGEEELSEVGRVRSDFANDSSRYRPY
ncbi:regulator of volume decrease after cellular swelling-domain-containing protein [Pterulicium gracile]|uniref:Regulator of volume decrease after cellular swelling-domain-containing protein n=1 Tax=Pterulicium gracile TaxID=1884261 RepID=A0A5C3Q5A4_9AGAR|nr:regulator of volume decrease after cellular swelling-domain-containing protein [Pterula gracilis]